VALNVSDLVACEHFYVDLLGMAVEWRPDADNLYLSSGNDNLALHRSNKEQSSGESGKHGATGQRLDHIGFIIDNREGVDEWYRFLVGSGVEVAAPPKTHRDGARSFYVRDPDGNTVQLIYHPPISGLWFLPNSESDKP
jgi:catechol 2,3-dioxygenase-like lactoylglutathione lyase family enzyme